MRYPSTTRHCRVASQHFSNGQFHAVHHLTLTVHLLNFNTISPWRLSSPLLVSAALPFPLQLLKKLPMGHPRGMALQQFAAMCLLERLLPAAQQGSARSAVNRRAADALDPVAVISAQPWLADPKALVAGATSGGGKAPRGGYLIGGSWLRVCGAAAVSTCSVVCRWC
jgi:hypothetical protein